MKFGIDSDGNYGYIKAGADTVTPFKSGTLITSAPITMSNKNSSGWYRTAVIDLSAYDITTISNIAFTRINSTDVASCLYVSPAFTFSYSNKKLTVNFNTSNNLTGVCDGTTVSLLII